MYILIEEKHDISVQYSAFREAQKTAVHMQENKTFSMQNILPPSYSFCVMFCHKRFSGTYWWALSLLVMSEGTQWSIPATFLIGNWTLNQNAVAHAVSSLKKADLFPTWREEQNISSLLILGQGLCHMLAEGG